MNFMTLSERISTNRMEWISADRSVQQAVDKIKAMLQHSSFDCYSVLEENSKKSTEYLSINKGVQQHAKRRSGYLDTVRMLVNFLNYKDEYTNGHCERVAQYTVAMGQAYDFDETKIVELEFAALLHDIGKLAIPDEIINKEGKLSDQEYEIVKQHPVAGYEIIKGISFLDASSNVLLQHHERVDGKGYPMGLISNEIGLGSKILAVADAYDAMTSERPYRKRAFSYNQAIAQLEFYKGSQFDGEVVDTFIKLLKSKTSQISNNRTKDCPY